MSSANHPERFPADADFTARNNRVEALIAKYKSTPGLAHRPTYLLHSYDRPTAFALLGLTVFGAFHLTKLVSTMFRQGIAVNGHPSERQ